MIGSQMSVRVANWDLGVAATQESGLFLSVWSFVTHH